jgi:hypothetical protein
VNRNSRTLFSLTNRCSNYLPVYMKVNHVLICVYLKVFCMLAMRKIFMSSLFSQVKKYFLYAQMSIQCVEYAFPVIYLLLVARNI